MEELVEEQLGTIQLLQAMFPLPSELVLSPETSTAVAANESGSLSAFELTLRVLVNDDQALPVELAVSLSLIPIPKAGGDKIRITVRQPPFLNRAGYEELVASMPAVEADNLSSEVILSAIDHVRSMPMPSQPVEPVPEAPLDQDDNLERVWFWFPSLSTREKRRDLVEYAGSYSLTGFVLAGKPGLLCVEGDGQRIDRYMAAIKSESWGDIPSHQKKVTERLRRPLACSSDRKFTDMTEITHLIPQHGQYNHRGDMGEVKRLMDQWGVGDDFGAVVMNSGA